MAKLGEGDPRWLGKHCEVALALVERRYSLDLIKVHAHLLYFNRSASARGWKERWW
jgi:hypothetical protein